MSSYKSGRFSNDEIIKVVEMVESRKTYHEIGEALNRDPKTVQNLVENKMMMNLSEETQNLKAAENDIKCSPEWNNLAKQLSPDEQNTFLHHWCEIVAQFKGDIAHTERLQVIDVIRNEILINRNLEKQAEASASNNIYRAEYINEMAVKPEYRDTARIIFLQERMADCDGALGRLTKEYKDLVEKKQQALRDIKGTREQRVKRMEESKESITGWVAALMDSPELRERLGKEMEKFRIAQEVEYIRLSDYHKYDDGVVDQPILNAETLKEDNY